MYTQSSARRRSVLQAQAETGIAWAMMAILGLAFCLLSPDHASREGQGAWQILGLTVIAATNATLAAWAGRQLEKASRHD